MAHSLESVMKEGRAPLNVPTAGKPCSTWYRVYGPLNDSSKVPVIALHGGPGCGHEYMKPGIDLWTKHGIPVVLYDQIGCGASTNLPEKCGDESFWTVELFRREIDNLVAHLGIDTFDLWGHSWGSMLASDYAFRQPKGLRKLILMGGLASVDLYLSAVKARIADLPQQVQDTIRHFDETGDYDAQEYKEAYMVFCKRYMCRLDPWPEDVSISVTRLEDPTVYRTMYVQSLPISMRRLTRMCPGSARLSFDVLATFETGASSESVTVSPLQRC